MFVMMQTVNHSSCCRRWRFILLVLVGCCLCETLAFVPTTVRKTPPTLVKQQQQQQYERLFQTPNGEESTTTTTTTSRTDKKEEEEDATTDNNTIDLEAVLEIPTMLSRMASDVMRRVRWGNTVSPAQSASLYMNPATQRLATNLTVSWEPHVAEMLQALQRLKQASATANKDDKTANGQPPPPPPQQQPLVVGVVGIPGSGKSTSCDILASYMGEKTIVMPMDGYHYSLEALANMPDPADVIYRRGAPDTFDPASLLQDLERIKYGSEESVSIPGFDHAIGDPQPHQHVFARAQHETVIVEGIYLMHQADGWEQVKSMLDFCIYIDADVDICIDRLKIRNQCIPGYTPEEIEVRCEAVDRVNAETVLKSSQWASLKVQSSAMAKPLSSSSSSKEEDGPTLLEECQTFTIDEIATEEEIEQYGEIVLEEAEAIIQDL